MKNDSVKIKIKRNQAESLRIIFLFYILYFISDCGIISVW